MILLSNQFWQKIDFLLVASIADNSPNVIHEAKKLGIPVIGTKVGGITEMLSEPFDILLNTEEMSFIELIFKCNSLLENPKYEIFRSEMIDSYNKYVGKPVLDHIETYQNLLSEELN